MHCPVTQEIQNQLDHPLWLALKDEVWRVNFTYRHVGKAFLEPGNIAAVNQSILLRADIEPRR